MASNSGTLPGNQQAPQAPSPSPCDQAREAAEAEAELQRDMPKRQRPRAASGLRARGGQTASGYSGGGNNGVVEDVARSFPPNDNNCGCAELNTISNAMDQGIDVRGSVIVTVEVRGRNSPTDNHGAHMEACSVCAAVLEELEIIECPG